MPKSVLSLFDRTGVMVKPWLDAGYECWIVDVQHEPGVVTDGNLHRVGADVLNWIPPRRDWAIGFSFFPCTDLAVSGARWFVEKGPLALRHSVSLAVRGWEILNLIGCPWMLENPVGVLNHYWPPDKRFDPCDFGGYQGGEGDSYTKRTCLWTGGGFVMPEKRPIPATDTRIHTMPPSEDRADLRSVTPAGFARAVFEANAKECGL